MTSRAPCARRWLAWLAAVLVLGGALAPAALAARPPAPRLLPHNTVALVSVADAPELGKRFMNTAMGRMSQDPQLKPLVGRLYGSLTEAVAAARDRLGLSLPELLAIPQGEVTVAVVAPEEALPAIVALVDAREQIANARKLVERITARMDESGIRHYEETLAGTKLTIYEGPGAGRRTVFLEKDATIVVGTDVQVVKGLLALWNGGKGKTIADNPNFTAVMRRCRGAQDEQPQLVWYADPIGIMRGVGQENTGVRVAVALLPALGLDGLTAVGGSITLDTGEFDSVMHVHVLLDAPRTGIIKMIALEPGDATPERWVPADVAGYTTLHWNVQKTYEELAALFDSFRGEGAFAQFLQQRLLGPTGIDFEKELLPALEGRVTYVNWMERPATVQGQASLVALKLKDTEKGRKALEKVTSRYQAQLARETWAGKTYYQVRWLLPEEIPPEQRPPQPCFGILDDYLLMANRATLYKKAISTLAGGTGILADDPEFKLITGKIRRQSGGNRPAMIGFDRPEETVRWIYDLVASEQTRKRLGQGTEESGFFKVLDAALKENPLPPFAVLRQYLAPGGAMLVDEPSGLHYMAFTLRRESD